MCAIFVYLQHIILKKVQEIYHINQLRCTVVLFTTQNCGKIALLPAQRPFLEILPHARILYKIHYFYILLLHTELFTKKL